MSESLKKTIAKLLFIEDNLEACKEFIRKFYVPGYKNRTEEEHDAIRRRIVKDPNTCDHLKGGPLRSKYSRLDYNISHHRFIDGTERVRCLDCGRKWFRGKADWAGAVYMLEHTTNTVSSSEIPIEVGKLDPNRR